MLTKHSATSHYKELLLSQYDDHKMLYEQFTTTVRSIIRSLVESESIATHTIDTRIKERDSLDKKIEKKDKYTDISEITDICGLRIVTYYSDDVDKIAALINNEFEVDHQNSIDKRAIMEPDRFGYLSLHYVVSLSDNRLELPENKKFENLKIEIQIRTILQHTWAEIEHDLGYKSKSEIPKNIRRNFSRLAGLFEIADDEFLSIRNNLVRYEEKVSHNLDDDTPLKEIDIDSITLKLFIMKDPDYRQLLIQLKENFLQKGLNLDFYTKNSLNPKIISIFDTIGIDTIEELQQLLQKSQQFCEEMMLDVAANNPKQTAYTYAKGTPLLYAGYYYMILHNYSEQKIMTILSDSDITPRKELDPSFYEHITRLYHKTINNF